jgi:DNA-binding beta-propeller fold protein YncE
MNIPSNGTDLLESPLNGAARSIGPPTLPPRNPTPLRSIRPLTAPNPPSIDVGIDPLYSIYDGQNGDVYISNDGSRNVSVIDGTQTIGSIYLGTNPTYGSYDPENGWLYYPNASSGLITIINGTTIIGRIYGGYDPAIPVYNAYNGYMYVPNFGSHNVSVLSGKTIIASVNVGSEPNSIVYDNENHYIYVLDFNSNSVSIINGTMAIGLVTVGTSPSYAAYDPTNECVYVVNTGVPPYTTKGTVSVIRGESVITTIQVGFQPQAPVYDSINGLVYVTNLGAYPFPRNGTISIINQTTLLGSIDLGIVPTDAVVDEGNGHVYVPNTYNDNVSVIDGFALNASIDVGADPAYAVYDGKDGYVYVPNEYSNNISLLFGGAVANFSETGLPNNTKWWVNVTGGPYNSSSSSNLSVNVPDGSDFSYSVATSNKTYSSIGGTCTVNRSAVSILVIVHFHLVTYPVTFHAVGLSFGVNWSVSMLGARSTSNASLITIHVPNGTYLYELGNVPGWTTGNYTGFATINGRAASVQITWSRVVYVVTWVEQGLPVDTGWWVNVSAGGSGYSETGTITLSEPNGSYSFVTSASDKTYASAGGDVSVDGPLGFEEVTFYRVTYGVSFLERGLPWGSGWSVDCDGTLLPSITSEAGPIDEPNGTFSFTIGPVSGYSASPRASSLVVNGGPVAVPVNFTPTVSAAFAIAFTETGLPRGTVWSVTLGGLTLSAPGDCIRIPEVKSSGSITFVATGSIVFPLRPNGSYIFAIGYVEGYEAHPSNGTIEVRGANITMAVVFQQASALGQTILGLPAAEGYGVLGGVISTVLTAVAAVVLTRRGGGKPSPEPAKPPAENGRGDPTASP